MNHTVTVLTQVSVEVDMSKFPVEALIEEVKSRLDVVAARRLNTIISAHRDKMEEAEGYPEEWVRIPVLNSGDQHPLHGIYYAMKFGKESHALDLMRDFLGDQFGVVL
jgi:hypothetical protein